MCLSGIHFDGITKADIDEISQSAFELAKKAARMVEDRRLKADATASNLLAKIEKRAEGIVLDIESLLATPWETVVDTQGPAAAESFTRNFGDRVSCSRFCSCSASQ